MHLDIKTLFIATSVVIFVNALILLLAWRSAKSLRAPIGYWSIAFVLAGTSMVLMAFRNVMPDFFSIVVATACVVGSQVVSQEGIAQFMGKPGYLKKPALTIWGISVASSLFFTYINPSVNTRIVGYSISAALLALIGIKTLRMRDTGEDAPRGFTTLLFIMFMCLMIFRITIAVTQAEYADLLKAGLMQEWIALGILCFCTSLSLCFFWLISHQLGLNIQKQALTDSLTGLSNRRAMDNMIEKLLPVALKATIGFLLIDIDDFKEVNDKFGHQAGDAFLVRFGQEINTHLRMGDSLYRYAGDEFVVLVQNCDENNAMHTAERLRQTIENMTVDWCGHTLQSTVSIGIALCGEIIRNYDECMRVADKALYLAKGEGGNCVKILE